MNVDSVAHLLTLAASLESEGQYNNAKLMRVAVDSLLTRAAYDLRLPADRASLQAETTRAWAALAAANAEPALLAVIEKSLEALAAGRLPLYADTPDPYVCRICGHLTFVPDRDCPVCDARPGTFKRVRPIYWLEALDPVDALERLRRTPLLVAALLDGVSEEQANRPGADGGWSLRQGVSHLKDAQGVLEYRVNLILEQDNPVLESKAVFEWAGAETARPPTLHEVFDQYCASRERTAARLEGIPLKDWWRRGRHEEFGELKLYQQVSYFASHEPTHLPQLARLAKKG